MEDRLTAIETKLDEVLQLLKSEQKKNPAKKKIKVSPVHKSPIVVKKSGNATINLYDNAIIVTGNTYGNKEHLKSVGARWNKDHKGWKFPRDKEDELRDVIDTYFSTSKYITKHESLESEEQEKTVNDYHPSNAGCDIDSDSD